MWETFHEKNDTWWLSKVEVITSLKDEIGSFDLSSILGCERGWSGRAALSRQHTWCDKKHLLRHCIWRDRAAHVSAPLARRCAPPLSRHYSWRDQTGYTVKIKSIEG